MSKPIARADHFTATARLAARKARRLRADERAAKLAPVFKAIQAAGITTLNGIAEALNKRHIPTPSGHGHWYAVQVARVLARCRVECSIRAAPAND